MSQKVSNILLILLVLVVTSCSTTKNLPEGEKLYIGIKKTTINNEDKSNAGITAMDEVLAALNYPPNGAILGSSSYRFPIPFGLWVYNDFVKYQDKKGIGNWIFKKMAADPVLLSEVNPDTRVKVASNLLHDYGFFNGNVGYSVVDMKNPKKVKIDYSIDMGKPYFLDSVEYVGFTKDADSLIYSKKNPSLLKKGENFSVILLENERQRLSELFRNNGYFYYRPDFITYQADTIQRPSFVSLRVLPIPGLPNIVNKRYVIGNTSVYMNGYNGETPNDSVEYNGMKLFYSGKRPGISPSVLRKRLLLRKGRLYSQRRHTSTQDALAHLGVFKYSEFRYTPKDTLPGCDTLNVVINTMFDQPYDGELQFNVTTKSTDQTGPGAEFNLSRRNFMRTAARLNFQLKGSYEWQTNSSGMGDNSKMNSYELGTSVSLEYPSLLLPWKVKESRRNLQSHTTFKLYADQLNRARFFKMLSFGGTVSYDLKMKRVWKHVITPFRLTFNTLESTTAKFDSITTQNKSLAMSLGNQFIPAMSYDITYDNTPLKKRHNLWWNSSITSSGNVTSLLFAAMGKGFNEKEKKLLNSPFAQFLKFTSEIRCLFNVGAKQQIATRLMGGVIYSYGNMSVAPYSEQFYIGGANSIRGFTVRSLGPGSFHPSAENRYGYIDETGDIKFEANVEYRFPLLGSLYGATFLDAGNVWLLKKDDERPGGEFTMSNLGKTIALGTGVGLRYDLTFLVLRLDLGIALHAPYDTGKKGYYNIPKFKDGLGLHFAIGYPF